MSIDYKNQYGKYLKNKIDNKEQLTEDELNSLMGFEVNVVEQVVGDSADGYYEVASIINLCGDNYMLNWLKSDYEMHVFEDRFHEQPYKVEKKERVVTETYWEKV